MSEDSPGIESITARLREIASSLRDSELSDADAEVLAREAADLVAAAGNEVERLVREAAARE